MSEREAWQVSDDAAVLYERSFVPALFAASARVVADATRIAQGDRVLDVGCGTGIVAREAAKRTGNAGRVVGLDCNPRMLEVAREVAPAIEWRAGDAGSLPFEDAAFDVVTSQFALMFFSDPASALREMWRVLRSRGRLAVAVCGPHADAGGYAALAEVAARVCSRDVLDLLRAPFALGQRERLADLVRQAGILGAWIETYQCPVRFSSVDALVHTEVKASPIRGVIDAASFDALLEGARAGLARFCDERGAVAFAMPAHLITAEKA